MLTATQDSMAAIKEIGGTIDRITKIARNDGRAQAESQSRGFVFSWIRSQWSVIGPDQGQL
jgi:hypothetical protein